MAQTRKVAGRATSIRTEDSFTNVRYHNTDVVSFNDRCIVLRSGGWHSATTKLRMNQTSNQFGLGFNVRQKSFGWFVDFKESSYPFEDGMALLR